MDVPRNTNAYQDVLPGTKRIYTDESSSFSEDSLIEKHGDIILVPRPTSSPNDPLRWSLSRKIWHTALVCYIACLTAATSNVAGAASVGVNELYGISYDVFNTGAGILFLSIGLWTLFSSPLVHLYGRRGGYMISCVFGLIGNIWFGRLTNSGDAIWSQLFVGASESVAEAVVQLSLLDIWFEHQNGTSLGMYTLAMSVGTFLGPLVGGHVAHYVGWRWIGYMGAIFSGATLLVCYFGLEETAFDREHYLNLEEQSRNRAINNNNSTAQVSEAAPQDEAEKETVNEKTANTDVERSDETMSIGYSRPRTYWQNIALITPARNLQGTGFLQYMKRLWHTMRIFTFPAVWYAGIQWGMQNIAMSFYLTVEEDYWSGDPWNYSDAAVGNMNIACLVGSVFGCFYGGYCSDKFILWMSRRNGGIMESEFRLHLMNLCTVLFPVGMWLFGVGSARGWSWPVPYVGLGFVGFGYGCAGDLSITYLADSYPEMVLEGMVGVAVINNLLAMVFTFVASYWLDTGVLECFIALGVLSFVSSALSIPMVVWGKRFRHWTKDRYFQYLQMRDGLDQ